MTERKKEIHGIKCGGVRSRTWSAENPKTDEKVSAHKWCNYDHHLCSVFSVQELPFLGKIRHVAKKEQNYVCKGNPFP